MKKTHNMSDRESYVRFILATIILFISIYYGCYILAILSIIFYYTALKRFCFIYEIFHLNKRFSSENYYRSLLPIHNPAGVLIFNKNGKIVFKNSSANIEFGNINHIEKLNITNIKYIIEKDEVSNISYKHNNKTFILNLKGLSSENLLLAYADNITEIIKLNEDIENTQREIIYTMGEIGETRSKETGNHVKRVAIYSQILAKLYGLSDKESELLKMASPMHDIGKVGIPDAILNKPAKLTKDEFEIMKTHSELGYSMLKNSNKEILKTASIVAHQHHEKYNGKGYPKGLKGENIHIYGRITAIADVFDALGSDRVYKKAWELDRILILFKEERGEHFDPRLIDLFLNNLNDFLKIRDKFSDKL